MVLLCRYLGRGVPIRHIGHGWDRQRSSFNSCINKVGDRYATKLTGGFLTVDLEICNADVPFKTETIEDPRMQMREGMA